MEDTVSLDRVCTVGCFTKTEPKTQEKKTKMFTKKMVKTFPKKGVLEFANFAMRSLTRSLQSMRFRSPSEGTNTQQTNGLIDLTRLGADAIIFLF